MRPVSLRTLPVALLVAPPVALLVALPVALPTVMSARGRGSVGAGRPLRRHR